MSCFTNKEKLISLIKIDKAEESSDSWMNFEIYRTYNKRMTKMEKKWWIVTGIAILGWKWTISKEKL